jgi:hypothetical protein
VREHNLCRRIVLGVSRLWRTWGRAKRAPNGGSSRGSLASFARARSVNGAPGLRLARPWHCPGAVPWHFHSPGRSARRHLLFAEDTADQWRGLLRPLVRQGYLSGARAGAARGASPCRRRAIMNESHVMNGGPGPGESQTSRWDPVRPERGVAAKCCRGIGGPQGAVSAPEVDDLFSE